MSFAESLEGRATEVQQGAGYQYSYSLQLIMSAQASQEYDLTGADQRLVEYDATGNGLVKLPAGPDPWMEFEFVESVGGSGLLTIDGNGLNINGSSQIAVNAAYAVRSIRYVPNNGVGPTGGQWIVTRQVN